ncbi:TetR/AcrR family transcriptional regulator [Paenibacillus sp. VCA1]|uniref:TetR/AcrR family transcriptional regulator n=1 Tax=Paenibacillus sp. VCA1 TaxID=3039148 RepID=UPI002870CA6B|nr:TetR/AcrR family transcriptional regulator [Paenibacillus sp. VCA1]MDR9855031.1 TetR/AcrR family transcriptional regulator [Paenibacillus sp. VCA1]
MVQVLKEELRQAIVQHAQDEFAQHGFADASIKRIAANAGISVGNLYRYFPGKEALFDSIVSPVLRELEMLIGNHDNHPDETGDIFELVVHALAGIVEKYRSPLLILIDGSKGTRFETAAANFHRVMADNVAEHLAIYNGKQGRTVFERQAAWPVSVAFMQGYFEIVRHHQDPEDCKRMVGQYVSFWYQGLRAFL